MSTYENNDPDLSSDPRIPEPLDVEAERNHIRGGLSAGEKFNSLLVPTIRSD
jgi:hypothetical protein